MTIEPAASDVVQPLPWPLTVTPVIEGLVATDDIILSHDLTQPVPAPRVSRPSRIFSQLGHMTVSSRFRTIYGLGGFAMVAVFILSAGWTAMLAVIQLYPKTMANALMHTQDFDHGEFWLLPDPPVSVQIPAAILLIIFSLGYLGLVGMMLFPNRFVSPPRSQTNTSVATKTKTVLSRLFKTPRSTSEGPSDAVETPVASLPVGKAPPSSHEKNVKQSQCTTGAVPTSWTWDRTRYELTSPYGILRQYYNPILDLPKLIFQTSTLTTYLNDGFPVVIICIYSTLLFVNWMLSTYRYKRERPDPNLVFARVFYGFDLFFAVFAPLEVLAYSYFNFDFDRGEHATKVETLGDGSFDSTARLFADPAKVSIFRIAFHYLQFTHGSNLFIKCALNILSLFKWMRTIVHLIENSWQEKSDSFGKHTSNNGANHAALVKLRRRQNVQRLIIASIFFFAGCGIFIYSMVAIGSTHRSCSPHPECVIASYRWNIQQDTCPCIVYIDSSETVSSYDEWLSPPDTTAKLATMASQGHLKIIQIINRALPEFPDEMRRCTEMEQITLIYTKTVKLPEWLGEFKALEYLHIEGDMTPTQLTYMPPELFNDMPHLRFLHLGSLLQLPSVPSLIGVPDLQYLVLAVLHSITEVPRMDNLGKLSTLSLIDLTQVSKLPTFQGLHDLKFIALTSRNPVCCNGYMDGNCNLNDFRCLNRTASGEPLVQCTTARIVPADYKLLYNTAGSVCTPVSFDIKDTAATRLTTDIACGGTRFKQCTVFGIPGMCYNSRMTVVNCDVNQDYQTMRRLQIARGVGTPCDPSIEQWLGCK